MSQSITKNDCVTRALTFILGEEDQYESILNWFKENGFQNRNGKIKNKGIVTFLKHRKIKYKLYARANNSNRFGFKAKRYEDRFDAKTISAFERTKREGVFMLLVSGHVAAYKDGEVHDWAAGRQHRIEGVIEILG